MRRLSPHRTGAPRLRLWINHVCVHDQQPHVNTLSCQGASVLPWKRECTMGTGCICISASRTDSATK